MRKIRYITFYGYFGPTSNVKSAPAAFDSNAVSRILGAIPPRREDRK